MRHGQTFSKRCEKCGGMRADLGGPHGPRFVDNILRDCSGEEVDPPMPGEDRPRSRVLTVEEIREALQRGMSEADRYMADLEAKRGAAAP